MFKNQKLLLSIQNKLSKDKRLILPPSDNLYQSKSFSAIFKKKVVGYLVFRRKRGFNMFVTEMYLKTKDEMLATWKHN